jgi:hypothetical protein
VTELLLDHPKRMLNLRADARLDVFEALNQRIRRVAPIELTLSLITSLTIKISAIELSSSLH